LKKDIKSMMPEETAEYFKSAGEQSFRAQQVFTWLHKGVTGFDDMTDLSADLRKKLDDDFVITFPDLVDKRISQKDGTIKYLLRVSDNDTVECVFMEHNHGTSLCISTQIGCKMNCKFCASTLEGFKRNLSPSEMLDQILFTRADTNKRISNVVLMGTGEPLDNFDNVMKFLKLVSHPKGINIGSRHLTLSTCGITENIDRLVEYDVQLTLAISLHAPDDETRSYLIPTNRNTGVKELFQAGSRFFQKTGRRVTYEYAMIDGVNDSIDQAKTLSELLTGSQSHLNIIKLNDIAESELKPSSKKNVDDFIGILSKNRVNFTVRRSLGSDIEAACGQLRRRNM